MSKYYYSCIYLIHILFHVLFHVKQKQIKNKNK